MSTSTDAPIPTTPRLRCPVCRAPGYVVYRTIGRTQYRKCNQPDCGYRGKTIRETPERPLDDTPKSPTMEPT